MPDHVTQVSVTSLVPVFDFTAGRARFFNVIHGEHT